MKKDTNSAVIQTQTILNMVMFFELPSELAITMIEENVEVKMEEVPLGACY